MKRTEMRFRTRAKFIETREGEALTFGFRLGPVSIFAIVNMPELGSGHEGPLVYIKMDLRLTADWEEYQGEDNRLQMTDNR